MHLYKFLKIAFGKLQTPYLFRWQLNLSLVCKNVEVIHTFSDLESLILQTQTYLRPHYITMINFLILIINFKSTIPHQLAIISLISEINKLFNYLYIFILRVCFAAYATARYSFPLSNKLNLSFSARSL